MVAKRRSFAPERTASRSRQPRIEVEDHGDAGQWFVVYRADGKPVLWTQDAAQAAEKLRGLR